MNDIMLYSLYGDVFLSSLSGILGFMLLVMKIVITIKVIFIILGFVARYVIFEKAGQSGFKALIPIYNTYTKYKICNIWRLFFLELAILLLQLAFSLIEIDIIATILGLVASILEGIVLQINLGKVFNKGIGFRFGLILFPEIFEIILAFGDSKYMIQENQYDFHDIERH